MTESEWLANFEAKLKPITAEQREVLIVAFRQGAEACAASRHAGIATSSAA